MILPKLKYPWKTPRGELSNNSNLNIEAASNSLNVNEEYMETLRTKSYTDIWSKVQVQKERGIEECLSSLSPLRSYLHICDLLLEPKQDTLMAIIGNLSPHFPSLLLDYFEGSMEACKICGVLLHCIDQTRANYRIIQRVLKLTDTLAGHELTSDQSTFICKQFSSFAALENPLSGSNPENFQQLNDLYKSMLKQLRCSRRKIMRRAKFIRFSKRAVGAGLVITCGTLAAVALILTAHTFIGVLATPIIFCSSTSLVKWRLKLVQKHSGKSLARLGAQLDAAAKGAYILNRDFDTMSRLVTRLHDEIEHSKAVIRICLRNSNSHLLGEVIRELQSNQAGFLEQLEELEEHVYLCVLTINRARRLVIEETMMNNQQ